MNETTPLNKFLVPISVVLAGLFIGGAVIWNGQRPAITDGEPGGGAVPTVDIKEVSTDKDPYIGNQNAAVVVAYWSDYQCPFCKQFETQSLSQIVTKYVDTGKVKVVFKDFQFLGPDSDTAALYGRAVWDLYPERYWEWREAVFAAQDQEHGGFGDEKSIQALTKTIAGIDETKVTAAVKTKGDAYSAQIAANRTEAQSFGIQATPSSIIGKQMIAGAMPFATFDAAIQLLLK